MGDFTFVVEKPCPICEKTTRVVKLKSRMNTLKTDEDFCVHYKDFNPYLYRIWYCEHCGFATDENTFLDSRNLPIRHKRQIAEYLAKKDIHLEFVEERTLPDAAAAYQLAIHYEELINGSFNTIARLYHSMAWMYRVAEVEPDKEEAAMREAAKYYALSLSKERYPVGKMTDNAALYMVGAIYYRLKETEKAGQYLSRIVGDGKARNEDKKIYEKARDLWQEIKDMDKNKQKDEKK
ncbi:MAG: DUF2225 domain-containing protein [Selenomonadaceae bacterium]|nr:DUF2225 domain-containing protein [Selenomonadaceae bacterium]